MPAPRPYCLIKTRDQWLRAAYDGTALLSDTVLLGWQPPSFQSGDVSPLPGPAGLAFDRHCRLYHSDPDGGSVDRLLWAAENPLSLSAEQRPPRPLFENLTDTISGDFSTADFSRGPLRNPCALAVDVEDRLFIAETAPNRILVFDLWGERLIREIPLAATPCDLANDGHSIVVLACVPDGTGELLRLDAHADPEPIPWPKPIATASRVAASPSGELFLLEGAGTAASRVIRVSDDLEILPPGSAPFATDLEFQTNDALATQECPGPGEVLVVARGPGGDFLRFCLSASNASLLPPLKARGYDGRGILRTPDGRIGFWTVSSGFQHAVAARVLYAPNGTVTTFRLDSGDFQTEWGRVFLDACIPPETAVTLRCTTADEPPEDEAALARTRPVNSSANASGLVPHAELSPPMPPLSIVSQLDRAPAQTLHRRETGRELPWLRLPEGDSFETYEAPIPVPPGRYLWLRLELSGNTRTTPRVRTVRAEYPSHDYLRRLPKLYSRDPAEASFLARYLSLFEGCLGELEAKADARDLLLDPRGAPAELLPWLGSFVGLVFDERMARARRPGGRTVDVRRDLIRESADLFRFRGTIHGLKRFLQIYLDVEPIVIEKYRVRGLGAGALGAGEGIVSSSILGGGFRVGGAVGTASPEIIGEDLEDAFRTHAHRFTVALPTILLEEELELVRQILEVHRPAHTLVEICTIGGGLRVGLGSHVGLSSFIGRTGGFVSAQLGAYVVGRGSILGRPVAGTVAGAGHLQIDSHVG